MQKLEACKKCNSKNIKYNLWGMPSKDGIAELRKIGYTVNIRGCVLPLVDEKVFTFVCQNYGFGYGDIDIK